MNDKFDLLQIYIKLNEQEVGVIVSVFLIQTILYIHDAVSLSQQAYYCKCKSDLDSQDELIDIWT